MTVNEVVVNAAADSKNASPKLTFSINSEYKSVEHKIQNKKPEVTSRKISDLFNFFP